MRRIDMLSKGQKIVIVVALGLVLEALGSYLMTLGSGAGFSPFVGGSGFAPIGAWGLGGLAPWLRVIIWLILISVWALASVRVLRSPQEKAEPQ